jgi:hypothetical protein
MWERKSQSLGSGDETVTRDAPSMIPGGRVVGQTTMDDE